MKRSLLTLQVISVFVIGTITLTATSVAAENVNLNVNGERRAQEVTNEDGVTNEDFLDEDVDTEVELQPFRYTVSPTSDLLDMDQAMLVNQVIEGLMNEYLKSLPQDQVGIFKNITLGDPENITAGGSRRSLTGARRSLFPLSHSNLRKAETASSTTIYIDRISANFTNNPPQKDIIEGWLKKAVDNGETSCTNRAANTNTLTNTAIARNSAGAIETEIDSSCYNFNLEWKNEYEKTDEQPPSEPNPNPNPNPNPDPPTDTNGGLDSNPNPEVSVIVKPTKKSGMALPFAFCGGGLILIIISMFIVKKRRHQRSKALAWYLSKDGQGHQGIDGPEFDGLDYIHGMNTPRNMNMGGGSKVGGFPLFPVVQHSAPPSPEEIEVAIPQKVRSSESSVSSLGASDHKPPAYLAALATAPPVLTNLTRVNGNLYNETNEGFDQLEQDDAWVSESGMDNYRNMPRVLGSRNNSNPNSHATANSNADANANANPNPSEDMSSHQLHYSDTSSISLETEHFFAETSWNANANANDASNHDHDNVISAESSEEEMFTITRPLRSPSSLNQNPRQSQSQGKSQSQPQPSLHQNPQMQLRKKVLTAEEYNDLDLGVLEYDDKSSIGLPSVV